MIERMHTSQRMSKIVKHNGVVYLCGQVGKPQDNVADQTRECLRLVDELLAEAGTSSKNMLQAIIWLADMKDFAEMNAVWDAWVPSGFAPARACVQAAMARDVLLVEISVVAAEI